MSTAPDRATAATRNGARAVAGSSHERRIQVAAVAATMSGVLPVFLTGALRVQIDRDFPFSVSRLGLASGVFFFSAAVGSAAMGRLAERIGPGRGMRGAAMLSAVLLVSMSQVRSFESMVPLLLAGGLCNALAQVSANLLLARTIEPDRQGWSLALKQAGVPAGTLVGGLAVPVLAVTVGWQWAYFAAAVFASAAATIVPVREVVPGGKRPKGHGRGGDVPLGPLVLLASAAGLAAGANGALATFIVSAGVDSGLGESAAGLVLMVGSAIGITVRLVAGARADRVGGGQLHVCAFLLAGGAVGYGLLAGGAVATHLVGAAVAFGFGWAWPGLFNLSIVRLNPGAPAAATGITQTGVYIGALSGPIAFGFMVESIGYQWAWVVGALSAVAASGAMFVGRARVRRWRQASSAG